MRTIIPPLSTIEVRTFAWLYGGNLLLALLLAPVAIPKAASRAYLNVRIPQHFSR